MTNTNIRIPNQVRNDNFGVRNVSQPYGCLTSFVPKLAELCHPELFSASFYRFRIKARTKFSSSE